MASLLLRLNFVRQGVLHALQGISEREAGTRKRREHVARSLRKLRRRQSLGTQQSLSLQAVAEVHLWLLHAKALPRGGFGGVRLKAL